MVTLTGQWADPRHLLWYLEQGCLSESPAIYLYFYILLRKLSLHKEGYNKAAEKATIPLYSEMLWTMIGLLGSIFQTLLLTSDNRTACMNNPLILLLFSAL